MCCKENNPAKHLAILIDKLDKNIIPSSELIKDSGFSSKHPHWNKYLELKSNKANADRKLAEKEKEKLKKPRTEKQKKRKKRGRKKE